MTHSASSGPARRRVGLLGGTFDPPHVGHAVVAELAGLGLGLDELRFVVAGAPWMKSRVSPAVHRVELMHLVADPHPGWVVDRREVDREGPTYTVETLEALRDEEPGCEWLFLLGEDAAQGLPDWNRGDEALELATFVLVTRPGSIVAQDTAPFSRMVKLEVPPIDVSSTELRDRFRRNAPVTGLVAPDVEAYVREVGLFGAQAAPPPPTGPSATGGRA